MTKKRNRLSSAYLKLMQATNLAGHPMFNDQTVQKFQTHIRPDKRVSPGKFKPDPLTEGGYAAHPTTIKAMRKDLLVGGESLFLDLQDKTICSSCRSEIDKQFWLFCPFCESDFD